MTSAPKSSPAITLRPATVGDVPIILRCIQGLAEYEQLGHECQATEELLRESLFGEAPGAEVTLALADAAPAGFALWFRSYSTFLARPGIYLEDLFVFPEFRGFGIGKLLLTSLARTAVDRGYGRVEWAVLDWNVDAIGFYESLGARPNGEWTTYRLTGDALRSAGGFCDERR
ncbi:MAG: GNAT family N-acetyltransferase [bacterium]